MQDLVLEAKQMRRSGASVAEIRRTLGIGTFTLCRITADEYAAHIAERNAMAVSMVRDGMTCKQVAAKLGCSVATVQRATRGVERFPREAKPRPSDRPSAATRYRRGPSESVKRVIRLLGTMPDAGVAREAGVSRAQVWQIRVKYAPDAPRWTKDSPAYADVVGTATDTEIAAAFGVSAYMVRACRVARGVPSAPRRHRDACPDPELLGTMSDRKLAEMWGVHVMSVFRWRTRRGVRAYRCVHTEESRAKLAQTKREWHAHRRADGGGAHAGR